MEIRMDKQVSIDLQLSDTEAMALAQFVKRVGWTEVRANAASDQEGYDVRDALNLLQTALADAGYAPR
jgi:hypothetical protein